MGFFKLVMLYLVLFCLLSYVCSLEYECLRQKIIDIKNDEMGKHIDHVLAVQNLCDTKEKECRSILFELYFSCLASYFRHDYKLLLFIAVYQGNADFVKDILANDPDAYNSTDIDLYLKYSKTRKVHQNVLFLGAIYTFYLINKVYFLLIAYPIKKQNTC